VEEDDSRKRELEGSTSDRRTGTAETNGGGLESEVLQGSSNLAPEGGNN